ncbi:hypothetical protein [Deinococcus navajonensis]|uniref:Lipoprotein n=1 Tax=Deinococcus navajonensis TaxID=309884 RepID=A0ABV8XII2_9DEIO
MKKRLLMLSLPVSLVLAACDFGTTTYPSPVPVPQAQTVSGTVRLGTTVSGPSSVHTDADAVGRTLNLRLNNPSDVTVQALAKGGQPMFAGRTVKAQAIGIGGTVLANTTVQADRTFSMTLPVTLTDAQTFTMTNEWPSEGGENRVTCNRTADTVSDPQARLAASEFTLEAGGSIDHQDDVADIAQTGDAGVDVQTGRFLYYADRDVTYAMAGTCTMYVNQMTRTLTFDQRVNLKRGWNVVSSSIRSSADYSTMTVAARVDANWNLTLVGAE